MRIGNSYYFSTTRKGILKVLKDFGNAVEFRGGWMIKEEVVELINSGLLDDGRTVFVVIPVYEDEKWSGVVNRE